MKERRLYLKFPTLEDKEKVLDFKREFLENFKEEDIPGASCLCRVETYEEWLEAVVQDQEKATCAKGRVPSTLFLTYRKSDHRLVGCLQIRHELNDFLFEFGGHVGGSIRPTERCKGYSTEQIELALEKCKELGFDKVLFTCKKTNLPSARSIQKSGGVFENEVLQEGNIIQRYWIDLMNK